MLLRTHGLPGPLPLLSGHEGQVRLAVAGVASALDLDPEVVLAPRVQRYIAWAPLGRAGADEVGERMSDYGARPWQIELTAARVRAALGL